MRKEDLREATGKAASERSTHLKHRLSRGEKAHSKRMSTVATVYTIAPWQRTAEPIVGELAPAHQGLRPTSSPRTEKSLGQYKREPG